MKESAEGERTAKGRPIALLKLSAEERAYLQRQVRRHRVARSLSERCRIILRCADGLPSKHRPRTIDYDQVAAVIEQTLESVR
jgi:hypothetical protein